MASVLLLVPRGTTIEPTGTVHYSLKAPDGWLHFSLGQHDDGALRLTGIKAWRWIGTEKQLRAVRAKFPETKGFERIKLAPKPINPKL